MEHYSIRGRTASEISASVERAIASGAAAPGTRLPAVRVLAKNLGLSPATIAAAFRDLRVRGLIAGDGRRGTSVLSRPPVATRAPVTIPAGVRNLALGNPDPAFIPDLSRVIARLGPMRRSYGERQIDEQLATFASAMFAACGIPAEHLAVLSGACDGVERTLAAWLRPGDVIAMEDPGYPNVADLAHALGLRIRPMRVDEHGPIPAEFDRVLRGGAAAIVITPRAQNPTGAALTAERAGELRRIFARYCDSLLIEDDHAGPIAGAPALSLAGPELPRWAVVRSVSKSLGPDLRVALMAGDETTISRVAGRQRLGPGWVSTVLQQLVAELLRDADTLQLVSAAERAYVERRTALLDALARRGIDAMGRSGMNVWIPVAEEGAVAQALIGAGWGVAPGERYRIATPPAIRVTVAALLPSEAEEFADALAATLKTSGRTRPA
jgi:DNA-binding transcriptional MocR family regulator